MTAHWREKKREIASITAYNSPALHMYHQCLWQHIFQIMWFQERQSQAACYSVKIIHIQYVYIYNGLLAVQHKRRVQWLLTLVCNCGQWTCQLQELYVQVGQMGHQNLSHCLSTTPPVIEISRRIRNKYTLTSDQWMLTYKHNIKQLQEDAA